VPDQILAAYAALHLPNPAAGAQGICQYQTLLSCRSPVRTVLSPTPEASPVTHGRPSRPPRAHRPPSHHPARTRVAPGRALATGCDQPPAHQARLAESYRRLADLTPDETPNAALCRISGQVGTAGGTIGRSNAYGAGVQALSALTGYWLPSQTPNQLN